MKHIQFAERRAYDVLMNGTLAHYRRCDSEGVLLVAPASQEARYVFLRSENGGASVTLMKVSAHPGIEHKAISLSYENGAQDVIDSSPLIVIKRRIGEGVLLEFPSHDKPIRAFVRVSCKGSKTTKYAISAPYRVTVSRMEALS